MMIRQLTTEVPVAREHGTAQAQGRGRQRQNEIYRAGVSGLRPRVPVSWTGLQRRARKAMSAEAFAYIAGGAGLEETQDGNRAAFDRYRIVPRFMRDVSRRDTTVELFGRRLPAPMLLAPIGASGLAHREADVAVGRAAAAEGLPMIFSNQASQPMEKVAAAMGDAPRWFQLYWSSSDELVESLVGRAEKCGCEAIVVTLDTTMLGWRPRDLDLGHLPFARGEGIAQYTSDPVFRRLAAERAKQPPGSAPTPTPAAVRTLIQITRNYPGSFWRNLRSPLPRAAVETFLDVYSRPTLTWADLAFLRERTTLPIVLKGVLHPGDATRALDEGVDGLIVTNHGGRQLDGSISTVEALPKVVEAVADRVPVLMDSGIRGGADVFKALALGARAVCLGRPWIYGLGIAGERGVGEVLRNFQADFDLTLGLAGLTSVGEITPDTLEPAP